jgi:DNA polymerase-3 subunit beta
MKFSTSATDFSKSIESVSKFISAKPNYPILSTIKVDATGGGLTLTGFDLSHGIQFDCDAEIIDEGSVCIPATLIANLAKGLKGQIIFESQGESITITTLSGSFDIQGMDSGEYPELFTADDFSVAHSIDADLLLQGWKYVSSAASTDETKAILQGVNMQTSGGVLSLAATDGHRLTVFKTPVDDGVDIPSTTITAKTLGLIPRYKQDKINLSFSVGGGCLIDSGDKIIARIFDGKYPDYPLLLPTGFTRSVVVKKADIVGVINLMMSVSAENNLGVFRIADKKLSIESSRDSFKGIQSIDCKLEGKPVDIGFNLKYLIAGLKMFPSEKIKISMNDPLNPVIITGVDLEIDLLHLVMPVQIRS